MGRGGKSSVPSFDGLVQKSLQAAGPVLSSSSYLVGTVVTALRHGDLDGHDSLLDQVEHVVVDGVGDGGGHGRRDAAWWLLWWREGSLSSTELLCIEVRWQETLRREPVLRPCAASMAACHMQ